MSVGQNWHLYLILVQNGFSLIMRFRCTALICVIFFVQYPEIDVNWMHISISGNLRYLILFFIRFYIYICDNNFYISCLNQTHQFIFITKHVLSFTFFCFKYHLYNDKKPSAQHCMIPYFNRLNEMRVQTSFELSWINEVWQSQKVEILPFRFIID